MHVHTHQDYHQHRKQAKHKVSWPAERRVENDSLALKPARSGGLSTRTLAATA
jgi:hypothetical protein